EPRFALDLARRGRVPPPFPPHVAKDVKESRRLHDLSKDGPQGYMGIVQGERALARLAHGHTGEETVEEIYERPGAFLRPYIADEAPAGGSEGGQGSLTQPAVTPGEQPTQ